MSQPLIAPSILAADFSRLADEVAAVEGADWLHVDVMDNHFVPNLTLGLPVVESLRPATDIPLDCHLMIEDPGRWARRTPRPAPTTSPSTRRPPTTRWASPGHPRGRRQGRLSVKPGTPIEPYLEILPEFDTLLIMSVEPGFGGQKFITEVLPKVGIAAGWSSGRADVLVEIDGGINADTIEHAAEAGVDASSQALRSTAPTTRRPPWRRCGGRPRRRRDIWGYDISTPRCGRRSRRPRASRAGLIRILLSAR